MAFSLDQFFHGSGTRFLLHPQAPFLENYAEPEIVWVSSPAGSVEPGPADERMYTLIPKNKEPYGETHQPPFSGERHPPAMPGPDGHFDHLSPGTDAFLAAHMFGSVRRVLDIWEIYAGGPMAWHFQTHYSRLEMIARLPWKNAQFGWGYCECGEDVDDKGTMRPFALNFDVLAHEVGHSLIFSMTGLPTPEELTTDYLGFHESASDLVAIISSLHFESFIKRLLEQTSGDLYVQNELNRIGELSRTRQIRTASNHLRVDELEYRSKKPSELSGHEVHELGQPMTGAFFDIAVEFFLHRLVSTGAIPEENVHGMRRVEGDEPLAAYDERCCRKAYEDNPAKFEDALKDARDMLGLRLAQTWHRLRPANLTFDHVAQTFLDVDRNLTGPRHHEAIRSCFEWRGLKLT
ncbi:MAG: hypothetical protein AAF409_18885 [Pseudomonadota bacterium]